ncbi:MAG: ribbon-helix-helix protein, CopG family [Methanomicrobiales archaeon]|nr:ribbon-helix-helix protein, CopG family [Methanomicrobiales archaeon]
MAENKLDVVVDPKVKAKIQELVDAGEYASLSEFLRQAVFHELHAQEFKQTQKDALKELLFSDEGREIIRIVMEQEHAYHAPGEEKEKGRK